MVLAKNSWRKKKARQIGGGGSRCSYKAFNFYPCNQGGRVNGAGRSVPTNRNRQSSRAEPRGDNSRILSEFKGTHRDYRRGRILNIYSLTLGEKDPMEVVKAQGNKKTENSSGSQAQNG